MVLSICVGVGLLRYNCYVSGLTGLVEGVYVSSLPRLVEIVVGHFESHSLQILGWDLRTITALLSRSQA